MLCCVVSLLPDHRLQLPEINTLDLNAFKDDIAHSDLPHDVDPEKLGDLYNNTLRLLLDRHAQITSMKVLFRHNVPRKAEGKWRSTRCQSNRNYVTSLMNKARQDYYSDLISNKGIGSKNKNAKKGRKTILRPPYSCCVQKTARKKLIFKK